MKRPKLSRGLLPDLPDDAPRFILAEKVIREEYAAFEGKESKVKYHVEDTLWGMNADGTEGELGAFRPVYSSLEDLSLEDLLNERGVVFEGDPEWIPLQEETEFVLHAPPGERVLRLEWCSTQLAKAINDVEVRCIYEDISEYEAYLDNHREGRVIEQRLSFTKHMLARFAVWYEYNGFELPEKRIDRRVATTKNDMHEARLDTLKRWLIKEERSFVEEYDSQNDVFRLLLKDEGIEPIPGGVKSAVTSMTKYVKSRYGDWPTAGRGGWTEEVEEDWKSFLNQRNNPGVNG